MDLVLARYIQRGSLGLGAFPGPVRCSCLGSDPWPSNPQQMYSQGEKGRVVPPPQRTVPLFVSGTVLSTPCTPCRESEFQVL